MRFIGVELDSISGRIARLLHPGQDIRIENFRDTRLPDLDAVIGNVPFADVKLDHKGQRLALHDFFMATTMRRPEIRRRAGPGHVALTLDKQNAAIRDYSASEPTSSERYGCPPMPSKRKGPQLSPTSCFSGSAPGTGFQTLRSRMGHKLPHFVNRSALTASLINTS